MLFNKRYLLVFIFFIMNITLFAQIHRNSLLFVNWEENSFNIEERAIIEGAFLEKIARLDQLLVTEARIVLNEQERIKYLLDNGYDSYILLALSGGFEELTVKTEIYDFTYDKIIDSHEIKSLVDKDFINILGGFWIPFVDRVSSMLFSFSVHVPVRFKTIPFARFYGFRSLVFTADENGDLLLYLRAQEVQKLVVVADGYFTKRIECFAEESSEPIVIEMEKKLNINFDIGLENLSYLKIGIGYYFIPDKLFVALSTTIYQAQFYIPNMDSEYNIGGHLVPQTNTLSFRFGGSVNMNQYRLRLPIALELSLRMNHQYDDKLDPSAYLALSVPIGLDVSLHDNVMIYIEWTPTMYITKNIDNFYLANMNGSMPSEIFLPARGFSFDEENTGIVDLMRVGMGLRVEI